ncbi:hypothetical protein TNCV_1800351 [Trichonephila clavipes]|nr:hypothetical protein TNCV_1800351 [Trichonephila clavipes]
MGRSGFRCGDPVEAAFGKGLGCMEHYVWDEAPSGVTRSRRVPPSRFPSYRQRTNDLLRVGEWGKAQT